MAVACGENKGFSQGGGDYGLGTKGAQGQCIALGTSSSPPLSHTSTKRICEKEVRDRTGALGGCMYVIVGEGGLGCRITVSI